jgi:NitT/TauT family transport system substrate-binding protein
MILRRDILIAAVAVALAAVIALGCIGTDEEKDKITTLRIGYQPSTHQVAAMVAMEEGWWLEELKPFGIVKVEAFEFPSGPPEMQAMLGGHLDVAYVGAAPPITAISQGLDAKIVAGVNTNGSNLMVRPEVGYDGPHSLKGLTLGTFPPGSIQDTVLKKWLKDNGMSPEEIDIKSMGPGDAVTAISAKRIDCCFLPTPAPSIIELAGTGRSVVASGEMWPNHACCALVVSGKLIRNQPELVEEIIRIHIKANRFINENPERAAEIYSAKTGQDLAMVKHSIEHWDGGWISDPHMTIPSTMEFARINYELGYTGGRLLTENDLFDTSFYDRVMG